MEEERIHGTAETMLQSLYARAGESEKTHHRIYDAKAIEAVHKIHNDFTEADKDIGMSSRVLARTIVLDQMVSAYIKMNPECIVINIACGMDTRFYRVDNGKIRWYNIDLPVTMALRAEYIQENKRVTNITASATEEGWTERIDPMNRPVLVIVEDFSMYLKEKEVRNMLSIINHHFSNVTVFMEIRNLLFGKRKGKRSVDQDDAELIYRVKSGKELVRLCPSFHWIRDVSVSEGMKETEPFCKVIGKVIPFLNLSDQIAVIRK